jgi:hypothetical protein
MFASNLSGNFLSDTELELMTKNELISVIRNFQRVYSEKERDREAKSSLRPARAPSRDIDQLSEIKRKSISDMSVDSRFDNTEEIAQGLKYKMLAGFLISKAVDEHRNDLLDHASKILNDKPFK